MNQPLGHPTSYSDEAQAIKRYKLLAKTAEQHDTITEREHSFQILMRVGHPHKHRGIGHKYWDTIEANVMYRINKSSITAAFTAPQYQASNPATLDEIFREVANWARNSPKSGLYHLKMASLCIRTINNRFTIKIPVQSNIISTKTYQDGTSQSRPMTLYHGTRPRIIQHILKSGLASSPCSHGYTGVWANKSENWATQWNTTPLDFAAGAALEITAEQEHWTANRKTGSEAPEYNKGVIRLINDTPTVRVNAVIFVTPTSQQLKFRTELHTLLGNNIRWVAMLQSQATLPPNWSRTSSTNIIEDIIQETIEITEYRTSYIGALGSLDREFGGRRYEITPAAGYISMYIARIIHIMGLTSIDNRQRQLQDLDFNRLFPPTKQWLIANYPGVNMIMANSELQIDPEDMKFWPKWKTQPWGHLASTTYDPS